MLSCIMLHSNYHTTRTVNAFAELRNGTNPEHCHHGYFRMSTYTFSFDYILDKINQHMLVNINYCNGFSSSISSEITVYIVITGVYCFECCNCS